MSDVDAPTSPLLQPKTIVKTTSLTKPDGYKNTASSQSVYIKSKETNNTMCIVS